MSVEPDTYTDSDDATVWVVTYRVDDGPHSHVAGVYDDETPAREHKRHLADNALGERAIAWGVHEQPVDSAFNGGL